MALPMFSKQLFWDCVTLSRFAVGQTEPQAVFAACVAGSRMLTRQNEGLKTGERTFSKHLCQGHLLHSNTKQKSYTASPLRGVTMTEEEQYTESEEFGKAFKVVLKTVTENDDPALEEAVKWVEKAVEYNVPHGKRNRGLAVVWSYKVLTQDCSPESLTLARILGWCVEMLQGFYLISDDIMDSSYTRRGRPCWYQIENVGLKAVNDAGFLENCVFFVLKKYFSNSSCYTDLLDLFIECNRKTHLGQCLDMLSEQSKQSDRMEHFTPERYEAIVKYKTAYYSFSLPVRLALYLAGNREEQVHAEAEHLLLKIGHFFQVQDDFLDCFGDPAITGKIGTDIEDGKCSWMIVNALQMASSKQQAILKENYGIPDPPCTEKVKRIYHELNLVNAYHRYEKETFDEINRLIENISLSKQLPPELFKSIMRKIHKRKK